MMRKSERHLEEMLEEYNEKVNEYDGTGTYEQRLEAYLVRGTILSMLDSYVSALTDFDEAVELIGLMEAADEKVDTGSYIKAYVSRGELQNADGASGMAQDYAKASERLDALKPTSRHFDYRGIIKMCISCSEDLLDDGYSEDVRPFFHKAEMMLFDKNDPWSRNRYIEALNLIGQSEQDSGRFDESKEHLDRSIALSQELMREEELEDEMALVFALILRGDANVKDLDHEAALRDYEAAISILEVMMAYHRPEIKELLMQTHREVSELLMDMGDAEEAEKHMLRALELNVGNGIISDVDVF